MLHGVCIHAPTTTIHAIVSGMKIFLVVTMFLWFRATFPRYRYDQIMRLGWKALIPVTLVWIGAEMVMAVYRVGPWARPWYH